MTNRLTLTPFLLAATLAVGCNEANNSESTTEVTIDSTAMRDTAGMNGSTGMMTDTARAAVNLLIDISDRKLYLIRNSDTEKTYNVAIGMGEHPTPVGDFKIHQIDWNPDWVPPPNEDWSKDKDKTPPGAKDNPMGRVRIVYEKPYSIHGTKDLKSLGKAESHGSVRMANADVIELGRILMNEGQAGKDETWINNALQDSTKMYSAELPVQIPLTNRK
ncbi:MAG: L,D-transpeptidase [Sphingobacteriales bacterium]|nr:MAG: L,D-transpeptidase [Sphingobacteriales bacterium]